MDNNKCKNCIYAEDKEKYDKYWMNKYFWCRKNPPTEKGFPIVSAEDWCGEFNTFIPAPPKPNEEAE
jgi:hypothetical protein